MSEGWKFSFFMVASVMAIALLGIADALQTIASPPVEVSCEHQSR